MFLLVLVADIGNTNITLGIYKDDKLIFVSRLATQRHRTSEQYAIELNAVFNLENIRGSFEGAVISSVVPELTRTFKDAIKKNLECAAQDVVLTIFFSILLLLLVKIVSLEIIKAIIEFI